MKRLTEIAEYCQGILVGDGEVMIAGLASLDDAISGQISFVAQRKYLPKMENSGASAFIVPLEVTQARVPIIRTENPYLAYALVADLFTARPFLAKGISEEAWVGQNCQIDPDVTIHPLAYIGDDVQIKAQVTVYPGVYIGRGVSIGEQTTIYPRVTIMDRCIIGARVIIHSGVVVGGDGFGYARDGARYVKIPQLGIVQIDDDVEIGANTTIDRAALGKTWIKRGTKIDNLVQIAHNVVVGEDTLVISQVGIAGSVEVGNNVILAGQVGVAGHIKIGDRVVVGAKSGVADSLNEGAVVSGTPTIPHREWLRASACYGRLPDLVKEVRKLKERMAVLEGKVGGQKK